MMKKLLAKAEKKAVSVLKAELVKRRDGCIGLSYHRLERCLKYFYLKEFWKIYYQMVARQSDTGGCDCTTMDSILSAFRNAAAESASQPSAGKDAVRPEVVKGAVAQAALQDCTVRNLRKWVEVKLSHHIFRILESDGTLYIVAQSMDAYPVTMSADSLVKTVAAYDCYVGNVDFTTLLSSALLDVEAEEKSTTILTTTARTLVEDVLKEENISFDVRRQKNGRLCCTIHKWASWLPNKVFRTSFDTFRSDFIEAYKDFRLRNGSSAAWL